MAQIAYEGLRHGRTNLSDLDNRATGFLYKDTLWTPTQKQIHRLTVDNGTLKFIVLFQRGMDIGQIWYKGKQIGWDRDDLFLKHPTDVDLGVYVATDEKKYEGLGWLNGFYAMDAMVGPKHFGGPCKDSQTGEKFTLHDVNSYSITDMDSVLIDVKRSGIKVQGLVPILYNGNRDFERTTIIETGYGHNSLVRIDITKNTSGNPQIFDSGHHIQFGGELLWEGSKYVVTANLIARDDTAARAVDNALHIPAPTEEVFPEQVYFLEPRPIKGKVDGVVLSGKGNNVTVQMIKSPDSSLAGFVAHQLSNYDKVTLWQQYGGWLLDPTGHVWYTAAIEPANSFPLPRDVKRDGLKVLGAGRRRSQTVEIGALEGKSVADLEKKIQMALST